MPPSVAAFTDTYLPTVNGVTYTIAAWRDRYRERGGRMDVVYPDSPYEAEGGEYPVWSVPFPFYDGYRLGVPRVPDPVTDVDIVHAHSPFSLGLAGYRLARSRSIPLVVSYHTPSSEYASYLVPNRLSTRVASVTNRYERWYLERADLVLAPSTSTADHLRDAVTDRVPVEVHPNGVDIRQFHPTDTGSFMEKFDLEADRTLVGYTGRHGYEKNLGAIIEAVADLDVTLVFGGEGPATDSLRRQADATGVDARFLGFLQRSELPAFYSALDVFAFPSPVETEGIVAKEAIACGTPVVAVDRGALSATIDEGETGYHFDHGDVDGFRAAIRRALTEREELSERCLTRRDAISLDRSLDGLERTYESVLA